jgi:dTDP-4-dehydrorhamnose reductase
MEIWGGIECTVNRVGERWFDQTVRSGHHERLDDLDRFASLGLQALRYPVLWERVAPVSLDMPDFSWSDQRLSRIRALGMRPIAGLVHHGSGPAYTSLLDPEFPTRLARYARLVAERYPWVQDYTPVNEPLTTARFSGLYGFWYPHRRCSRDFVRALLTQLRGVVLAMEAIRRVNPDARLIQTEDCGASFGTEHTKTQVDHESHRRWLTWDLLTGRVDRDHPLHDWLLGQGATAHDLAFFGERPCPPDVLGLNYYLTSDRYLDERLHHYPDDQHGGNGRIRYADVEAVRARPEGIVGHEAHVIEAWRRYQLPVAFTEVHLSCTRDEQVRWLVESWRAAHNARDAGVDVRAITAWALLGSFDWDTLVTRAQGHYESGVFDTRSDPPRATQLASIVRSMCSGGEVDHPVLDGVAWWRGSRRILYGPRRVAPTPLNGGRRILVTGANGTLGRAFGRLCDARGLPVYLASRKDLDISNVARVDTLLRGVRPWAVINAAGYVRVDDAESEQAACWQANVAGAVTLAAACRRRGIPLLTFSSDLVFDGALTRPYTEYDAVQPLNVYGRSKAAAEARVRAVLPSALVIRTSAFFGPWDAHNFAAAAVTTLAKGHHFEASADNVVSPTYVPDLVNASLDLLIDGETGLWHLANAGSLSWYAFAQVLATAFDLPIDHVHPVTTGSTPAAAARPASSALASARGNVMRPLEEAIAAYVMAVTQERTFEGVRTCASR